MNEQSQTTIDGNQLIKDRVDSLNDRNFFFLSFILITMLTAIVYANSLSHEFTNWDDQALVLNNPDIRSLSIENLQKIFTPKAGSTFQPIRVLSYAIDYHFWELEPFGYHIVNTMLHALSAIFLYLALTKILNPFIVEPDNKSARHIALFSAMLFVVHPVNVESVAWITSRKYGLVAVFSFIAFYLYLKSSEGEKYRLWYSIWAFFATSSAMLSSPLAVTLPMLFILYDYCRDPGNNIPGIIKRRYLSYFPYAMLYALMAPVIWRALVAGDGGGASRTHHSGNPAYTLLTMFRVLYDYITNLILPFWLNNRYVDYISTSILDYKIIASICVGIMLVPLLCYQLSAGKKQMLFCLGWFVVTWLPVSNVIPISTKMADRYMYLPAIGLFLWFSLVLDRLYVALRRVKKNNALFFLKLLLLVSLSAITFERNKVWENSLTLWADSVKKDPLNYLAHNSMGLALHESGKTSDAIRHYSEALKIKPGNIAALNNLGNALQDQKRYSEAVKCYSELLQIKPNNARAHFNMANALRDQGLTSDAISHYSEALKISPGYAKARINLGALLYQQEKFDQAARQYIMAVTAQPDLAEAHYNLGFILYERGRIAQAIQSYKNALAIQPDYWEARRKLGIALQSQGKLSEAIEHYRTVIKLHPYDDETHSNLGLAYFNRGSLSEALRHYHDALAINSGNAEAHVNLGILLKSQGKENQAVQHFQRAIKIRPDYSNAHFNLGLAFHNQGQLSKAKTYYRKTLEIDSDFTQAHSNLGVILHGEGRISEAIAHYIAALRLGKDFAEAHNNLAKAYFQLSDYDRAVHHYSEALRINPNYSTARQNMEEALTLKKKILNEKEEK